MSVKTAAIGNAVAGIDMISGGTNLPKGAMRDVCNLDIGKAGGVKRRAGARRLANVTGAHSLWSNQASTLALCVMGGSLHRVNLVGSTVFTAPLMTGALGARMRYFEHDDSVFFTDGVLLGVVAHDGVRLLGVVAPTDAPVFEPAPGDQFTAGRYSAAYSFTDVRGEESGLSPLGTITLADVSGIRFTLPPTAPAGAVGVRVYLTPCNGDLLYECASLALGLSTYDATPVLGKQAANRGKSRMPAGDALAVFHGRLYVAQQNTVRFSEPFSFGLTDLRHNHVSLQAHVRFLVPVESGLFIGTDADVWHLAGDGPANFQLRRVSTVPLAVPDAIRVHASMLPDELAEKTSGYVAAWFSTQGVAYGLPSGEVLHPQATRAALTPSDGVLSFTQTDGTGRLVAAVPATSGGHGAALGD